MEGNVPPPPTGAPGRLSPDGWWRWDGYRWVLNAAQLPAPPPRGPRTGWRLARWIAGWVLVAEVTTAIGFLIAGVAVEISSPNYVPGGTPDVPAWLEFAVGVTLILAPLFLIAWLVLCLVVWRLRPRR